MPLVEEFSVSLCFTVFDDNIVCDTVKTDEHLVTTGDEHTFIICSMVVYVIPRVVTVVQIQVAAVVVAFDTVIFGVVANHADIAVSVVDVVLAVLVDVVVEPRLVDAHDIVLVAAQVEGHASRIDAFCGGLYGHFVYGWYQVSLLYLIVDGLDGSYRSVGDNEVG